MSKASQLLQRFNESNSTPHENIYEEVSSVDLQGMVGGKDGKWNKPIAVKASIKTSATDKEAPAEVYVSIAGNQVKLSQVEVKKLMDLLKSAA